MLINTNYFREEALRFLKTGYYTQDPIGSNNWKIYWSQQLDRCQNGYTVAGTRITGDHYFYLNFCQIRLTENASGVSKIKTARKITTFPDFWDGDYNFFHAREIARKGISEADLLNLKLDYTIHPKFLQGGLHMIVGKARRKGYSYKDGAIVANTYNTKRNSLCLIGAFEKKYLYPKGTMQMVTDYMNFLNEHTAFTKRRGVVDKQDHRRASFIEMLNNGQKIEKGFMSEVIAVTYKDNPDAARGKDADLVLFEEAGKFDNLKAAYLATKPVVEDGDITTGQMIIFGTGGDMQGGTIDFESMFYNPEPYNLMPFENIWDEGGLGTYSGFFHPSYLNKPGFIDKDGNSLKEKAIASEVAIRENIKRTSKDPGTYDKHITEYPFCIAEGSWVSSPENGTKKIEACNGVHINGIQPVYELITLKGRRLRMTDDHLVFGNGLWVHAKDLKLGDKLQVEPIVFFDGNPTIKIDTGIPFTEAGIKVDEDFAYLIGLYMADGSFYSNGKMSELSFVFDVQDSDVADHVTVLLEKYLGKVNRRFTGDSKNCIELRITKNRHQLKLFMDNLGLVYTTASGHLKRKVHVPDWVFASSKPVVAKFLQGIFEGDGFFNRHQRVVSLFSKHTEFLESVQILLTGFGINAGIRCFQRTNGKGFTYMENTLRMSSHDSDRFYSQIGVISKRKNEYIQSVSLKPLRGVQDMGDEFVSLTYVADLPVYDITTATHYYSCQGIKVHNCPSEAFLQTGNNIFPLATIVEHKNYITRSNVSTYIGINGDLYRDSKSRVKFRPDDKARPINKFPHDYKADNTGCIVIYQSPYREGAGDDAKVPSNLYVICHDPYGQDKTSGASLGATYVMKRSNNISQPDDMIVASYVGRPISQDDYNERLFMLAEFYNAKIGFENDRGDVIGFAKRFRKLEWLEEEFELSYNSNLPKSGVRRLYGMHMTTARKRQGEIYLRDWLLQKRSVDENGNNLLNLHTIYDVALLDELRTYNPEKGNFDRVSAMIIGMYHLKEVEFKNLMVYVTEQFSQDSFFERSLF